MFKAPGSDGAAETVPPTEPEMVGNMNPIQPRHPLLGLLVILVVAGMAALGVYFVTKLIVSILRSGSAKGGRIQYDEDFLDEITRTRDEKDAVTKAGPKKKERVPIFLGRMTPVQQIRYRYRQLSQKHPEWKQHNTARENLPETAAQLYEQARYSKHPVTTEDVLQFKKNTSKRTFYEK